MSKSVIVIGAGPGGHAAALEASRRGHGVTLIEKAETGGTCLNRGCIPSKFLLARSSTGGARFAELHAEQEKVLATLRGRMDRASNAARIMRIHGTARLQGPHTVVVQTEGGRQALGADFIILATGSTPIHPGFIPNHPLIDTSDSIFSRDALAEHLVVVGGGYIGCELACAFQGLGSTVTLIEKEAALLATQPEFEPASGPLRRAFEKRGMTVMTGTELKSVLVPRPTSDVRRATPGEKLIVELSTGQRLSADRVLLSLGRRLATENLGLEEAGVADRGEKITVNAMMQTRVPSIYAIGDLVSPLPLAHTAAKEAEVAVAHLSGESPEPIAYENIPRAIYTVPEAAAVGLTESQAHAKGLKTRTDRFHNLGSAKALAEGETDGGWTVLSDAERGTILGALILGAHATELIAQVSLAIRGKLTVGDLADTVFAHPTLSEGFHEAAKRALASDVRRLPAGKAGATSQTGDSRP